LIFDEQDIHLCPDNISTVIARHRSVVAKPAGLRWFHGCDGRLSMSRWLPPGICARYDVGDDSKIAAVLKLNSFVSLAVAVDKPSYYQIALA